MPACLAHRADSCKASDSETWCGLQVVRSGKRPPKVSALVGKVRSGQVGVASERQNRHETRRPQAFFVTAASQPPARLPASFEYWLHVWTACVCLACSSVDLFRSFPGQHINPRGSNRRYWWFKALADCQETHVFIHLSHTTHQAHRLPSRPSHTPRSAAARTCDL